MREWTRYHQLVGWGISLLRPPIRCPPKAFKTREVVMGGMPSLLGHAVAGRGPVVAQSVLTGTLAGWGPLSSSSIVFTRSPIRH